MAADILHAWEALQISQDQLAIGNAETRESVLRTRHTPFGDCLLVALDSDKRVLFANRHLCTTIDAATKKASYAPPHKTFTRQRMWSNMKALPSAADIDSAGSQVEIDKGNAVEASNYYSY